MPRSCKTALALAFVLAPFSATGAAAQPLGTYRWQLQPHCNVLTLSVVQQGGLYLLNGTDDQCGATEQASVTGLAFQQPSGEIGFGLTVVTPTGASLHVNASISIVTLNGSWHNSAGGAGSFVLTPGAGTGGVLLEGPPAGRPMAAATGGNQSLGLGADDQIVRSVTLVAPAPGRLLVNASGVFHFGNNLAVDTARCSITTASELDTNRLIIAGEESVAAIEWAPFSGTRGFSVGAGAVTINLVCDEFAGEVTISDTHMTALFVPGDVLIAIDEPD